MEPANQGYTLFPSEGLGLMHCSDYCKALTENAPHFVPQVLPDFKLKHGEEDLLVILFSEGCYSSVLSAYTLVQVTVCIATETASEMYGRPFVIFQLRTEEHHVIFSSYISDDFTPTEPLYKFPSLFSFEYLKGSAIVSQVLKMSLQHTEISSISCLLMKATQADASLAKYFSISHSHEK